ncbi:MAG: GspH/FimT family pseudopilin [Rubrivivax sp.]|nr:GspH/FimT family pseudopilin [Rubrivivax sp.]MDP3613596.1 GspH/FimT family pseudopilin [Rubrivivax sp.]
MGAFTLIELMIVVALVAIIITLAAPSFRDMILMQRLRGVNAQVVTDLSFARSEAVSRGTFVQIRFQQVSGVSGMSCYIIYARNDSLTAPECDCTAAEGSRCTDPSTTEIRTVQLPNAQSVTVAPHPSLTHDRFTIMPRTGGMSPIYAAVPNVPISTFRIETYIDGPRKFENFFGIAGRVGYCSPAGSRVGGEPCA